AGRGDDVVRRRVHDVQTHVRAGLGDGDAADQEVLRGLEPRRPAALTVDVERADVGRGGAGVRELNGQERRGGGRAGDAETEDRHLLGARVGGAGRFIGAGPADARDIR